MTTVEPKPGSARRWIALVPVGFAAVAVLTAAVIEQVLRSGTDPANTSAAGYLPLAWMAALILLIAFVLAAFVRRADVRLGRGFAWIVGAVSLVVSIVPWWSLRAGNADLTSRIYAGLHVPQGIVQFWDLSLVLKSIDCARFGFDVFAANNGCLKDPAIYGPGVLWLQYIPLHPLSDANTGVLGVVMIVVSSLFLVWLARMSAGLGQLVLLVAAVGGPWLLLLERGNVDAIVIWVVGLVVLLVRRWDRMWMWWIAAAVIWIVGTWKYYPFALGIMLIPALRLRRGWTVLVGYVIATGLFMVLTWSNFRFSSSANAAMTNYGDFVVLGRTTLVSRMVDTVVGASGWQGNDLLVLLLALVAVAWGVVVGLATRRLPMHPAMLATGGSVLYLASVLLAGFGWGYKAAFLLLCVPLVAGFVRASRAAVVASAVLVLALVTVQSVVVWNTVLATTSGIVTGSFCAGLGTVVMVRAVAGRPRRLAEVAA